MSTRVVSTTRASAATDSLGTSGGRPTRVQGSLASLARRPGTVVVYVVALWFSLVFLVWPNINLLITTFFPHGHFSTDTWDMLRQSQRVHDALLHSLLMAVSLSVTVNIVGVFLVLATRYFKLWGQRILWLGYATTFIYGGIMLAAGYKFIYGETGLLTPFVRRLVPSLTADWFSGYPAVLFVMTFACTTNHLLFLSAAIDKVDQQTIEAAQLMGASQWTILRRVVLPTLRPVLFAVTILTFLTGLGALSAPQVLGGRDFQTIAPVILTFSGSPASRDVAAILAILLGLVTIALLVVLTRVERSGSYVSVAKVSTQLAQQPLRSTPARILVSAIAWLLWLIYVSPPLLIVLYSFMDSRSIELGHLDFGRMTLANYTRVFGQGDTLRPLLVSMVYSGLAAAIVVVGLLFVARYLARSTSWPAQVLEYLLHVPWILPATMIALGLLMSYDHPTVMLGGFVLSGTTVILLVAYVVVSIPFALRLLKAAFASVSINLEEAASILGAGMLTTFRRVLFPLVAPTALAVFGLTFNSHLGDYDVAVFLAHPLYQPLGLAVKAATDGSGSVDAVANTFVYTVLLMVVMGTVMWAANGGPRALTRRLRPRRRHTGADVDTTPLPQDAP